MSSISVVGNAERDLEHMIARVALPAATRVPDRSSGDRAPQTPEKSRRQGKGTGHLPQGKSDAHGDKERHEEDLPSEQLSPAETQLYSPSPPTAAAYSKGQAQHNVDIRA